MISNNLNLVRASVDRFNLLLDEKSRLARDEMMTSLIQLSQEEIKGERAVIGRTRSGKKIYEKATSGLPPMNRTGNLRRSIHGEKFNVGFANYSAIVGPGVIYGRTVELGGAPTWTQGQKFPYMSPAWQKFQMVYASILRKHFGKGL